MQTLGNVLDLSLFYPQIVNQGNPYTQFWSCWRRVVEPWPSKYKQTILCFWPYNLEFFLVRLANYNYLHLKIKPFSNLDLVIQRQPHYLHSWKHHCHRLFVHVGKFCKSCQTTLVISINLECKQYWASTYAYPQETSTKLKQHLFTNALS